MTTLVTGATGLIGRALVERLERPRVSSRSRSSAGALGPAVEPVAWDPLGGPPAAEVVRGVDSVIHLAGAPIADGRWTPERKRAIAESREVGTRNLVRALGDLPEPPRVLVSASAVGFYGDRGDEVLSEDAARGEGFLSDVCEVWEREALAAERHAIRVVVMRMGIVLSPHGGALPRMLTPFRLGVGGRLGSGEQYMSWVHIDDVAGLFLEALHNDRMRGPVNVVSPQPVTNAEFTRSLAAACRRPAILPVPRFGMRLVFGEFSDALFDSQRAMPAAAEAAGYRHRFAELDSALVDCVTRS